MLLPHINSTAAKFNNDGLCYGRNNNKCLLFNLSHLITGQIFTFHSIKNMHSLQLDVRKGIQPLQNFLVIFENSPFGNPQQT